MLNPDYYHPPIVNTYPVTQEVRGWRALTTKEQQALNKNRVITAIVLLALWAAAAVAIYFLATTTSGHTMNAIYIPIVAIPPLFISLITTAACCTTPPVITPKFKQVGVIEGIVTYLARADIDKLCDYVEAHGGVAPLVQHGFILPQHGKLLVDYISAKSQDTPDAEVLTTLSAQWDGFRQEILNQYEKKLTLDAFIDREEVSGVTLAMRTALSPTLQQIVEGALKCKEVIDSHMPILDQTMEKDLVDWPQLVKAMGSAFLLNQTWEAFQYGVNPDFKHEQKMAALANQFAMQTPQEEGAPPVQSGGETSDEEIVLSDQANN